MKKTMKSNLGGLREWIINTMPDEKQKSEMRKVFENSDRLNRGIKYINDNIKENITLSDLADTMECSQSTVMRVFRDKYNLSPVRFVWNARTKMASMFILTNPEKPLNEVMGMYGFGSASHFSRSIKKETGMNPRQLKKEALDFKNNKDYPDFNSFEDMIEEDENLEHQEGN